MTIPDSPGRLKTCCEGGVPSRAVTYLQQSHPSFTDPKPLSSGREQGSCETRGGPHVRAIYLEQTHQAPQQRHPLCKSGVRNGSVARNGARQCLNHRGWGTTSALARVSVTPIPPRRLVRGYKPPPFPLSALSHRPRLTDPLPYSG